MSPEWREINKDVKIRIFGFLDYGSRCSMRLCSKHDRDLVDATNFKAEKFSISERFSGMVSHKSLIRIDIDQFTIWFIGKENLTRIDRAWNEKTNDEYSEIKQECRKDLVEKFLEKYHRKFRIFDANEISIVLFHPAPQPHWKIKCQNLTLYELGASSQALWLNQCRSKSLKSLHFTYSADVTDLILTTSENLNMISDCPMTDEQLAKVNAPNLRIYSSEISPVGFRIYLEKFLKFGGKNDDIEVRMNLHETYDFQKLLPENLIFQKIKTGEYSAFRAKITGGFINIHGIQETRLFRVRYSLETAEILCGIYKKAKALHDLDPITERFNVLLEELMEPLP